MVLCSIDTILKFLLILFLNLCLINELQWYNGVSMCQERKPGNSVHTQGLRFIDTVGKCPVYMPSSWSDCLVHTRIPGTGQDPEDNMGCLGWNSNSSSSSSRSSNGDSPGRKERHLMGSMLAAFPSSPGPFSYNTCTYIYINSLA